MPCISENNPKKLEDTLCIFDSLEEALNAILVVSYGLESTKLPNFDLSARTGISKIIREACAAGFNDTDKEDSKEKQKSKKIIELIESGNKKEKI